MDRREFLAATAALPLVPSVARDLLTSRMRPDSIDKIGLQLYTLRREMEVSVERTLYEVGRIGYKEVEFAGYFGRPARAANSLAKSILPRPTSVI